MLVLFPVVVGQLLRIQREFQPFGAKMPPTHRLDPAYSSRQQKHMGAGLFFM
jgi:hypothetical protein